MKKHCATETEKTENKQSACRRSPWKRQNKHCKTPDKLNAVCLLLSVNRTEFCTSLTLKLSGARFCASDLNAKLDLGDETEECHGLTEVGRNRHWVCKSNYVKAFLLFV
jgi:hypothetical protein